MPREPETTPLNAAALRSALKQIDEVAWALCHHLPVPLIALTLDEALNVSALINREIARG